MNDVTRKSKSRLIPSLNRRNRILGVSMSSYAAEKWLSAPEEPGRVVHVLRGCVNWVMPDGELFFVVARGAGNLPHGVTVDGPEDFERFDLAIAMPVVVSTSMIYFGNNDLSVDLSRAHSWNPVPAASSPVNWYPSCINAAIEILSKSVSSRGGAHLLSRVNELTMGKPMATRGGPVERRIASALQQMCGAIRRRDPNDFIAASEDLVGTGVGLTPSGDDVLLGIISVLTKRFGPANPETWFATSIRGLWTVIQGRTTQVSETFLGHALNGRFPERLTDLLQALDVGDLPLVMDILTP